MAPKQYLTPFIIYLNQKNFTIFLWEAIWYCTTFSLFITSLKCLHHIAHQSKYKIFPELNSICGVHICYTPTFKLYAGLHIVKLVSFYHTYPVFANKIKHCSKCHNILPFKDIRTCVRTAYLEFLQAWKIKVGWRTLRITEELREFSIVNIWVY